MPSTPSSSPKARRNIASVMSNIKAKITKSTEKEQNYLPSATEMELNNSMEESPDLNHCIPECKIKHTKNMIRCMQCMLYCHVKCVGEPTDYAGAWSCFDCRRQPRQIKTLMNDLGHALRQIRELNAIVNHNADEIHTLKGLVESSSSQICAL